MKYNPNQHHRRSIRLKGYNYAQSGAYFITVCAHQHRCLFGHIEKDTMIPNEYGKIIEYEWLRTQEIRCSKHINRLRTTPGAPVWQRGYYETILRNERILNTRRLYIHTNPARWVDDENHPVNLKLR